MSENKPSMESVPEERTTDLSASDQREAVRDRYATISRSGPESDCCATGSSASTASSCCGDGNTNTSASEKLGYSTEEIDGVADGADLGLGCGNPTALASLEDGQTVLDLGSGGGFDCFLAGREVGPDGHVIGVDMTPSMVERARENIDRNDATNVEFRLGEIEHLPIADGSVDVIISNCVVNLSADKSQVFTEAYRVLRPGGRLAISDVVVTGDIPAELRGDPDSVSACVAGAASVGDLEAMLAGAGFEDVQVEPQDESQEFIREWSTEHDLEAYITSATIEGRKPRP